MVWLRRRLHASHVQPRVVLEAGSTGQINAWVVIRRPSMACGFRMDWRSRVERNSHRGPSDRLPAEIQARALGTVRAVQRPSNSGRVQSRCGEVDGISPTAAVCLGMSGAADFSLSPPRPSGRGGVFWSGVSVMPAMGERCAPPPSLPRHFVDCNAIQCMIGSVGEHPRRRDAVDRSRPSAAVGGPSVEIGVDGGSSDATASLGEIERLHARLRARGLVRTPSRVCFGKTRFATPASRRGGGVLGSSGRGGSGADGAVRGRQTTRDAWRSQPSLGGSGAGDGTRTRDIQLGKLTLYQLSYTRSDRTHYSAPERGTRSPSAVATAS